MVKAFDVCVDLVGYDMNTLLYRNSNGEMVFRGLFHGLASFW